MRGSGLGGKSVEGGPGGGSGFGGSLQFVMWGLIVVPFQVQQQWLEGKMSLCWLTEVSLDPWMVLLGQCC